MRILVLQTGGFEHFLAAARAAVARHPASEIVGLVQEPDLPRARATGDFIETHALTTDPKSQQSMAKLAAGVDLCVVPFESRLGIYHWRSRRFPIVQGIPSIASYNGRGQFREWGRVGWLLNSVLICIVLRAVRRSAAWSWGHLKPWLDVGMLFGLAGIALVLRGLKAIGLHPFAGPRASRIPTERCRLVLFIPSMQIGGAQRQLLYFLNHLDRGRWDPEMVTLDRPDKFFESDVRALGVPVTYLNTHHEFWKVGVVWRLARRLYAKPCHVLHSWLHYSVALGAIAGSLAGVPVVVGSLRSERPLRFPWFYPKWQRGLDVLTAPLHTTLLANSNAVLEENRRWAFIRQGKLLTVYNGIDLEEPTMPDRNRARALRSRLGLPPEGPLVGIVGRLSPEKDHATFLKAAVLISRAWPETRFLIVGDGDLRPQVESEIARLGLADKVEVLGERKDAQVLIRALDILVVTSTSEGFPNVLLEAASGGTPVVTTAAGGVTEVVLNGETGFVVPCGDERTVSRRVLDLLNDPVLSRQFAQAAWERVKVCFSAEQAALAIQACYERDLSREGSLPASHRHPASASSPHTPMGC